MTTYSHGDEAGPIRDVREGMRVIDAAGEDVGTVAEVKMGDPDAATTEGESMGSGNFLTQLARGFGSDSGLHPQEQERLMRMGYLKIDGEGAFSGDGYVSAAHVKEVSGDRVQLDVSKDAIHSG